MREKKETKGQPQVMILEFNLLNIYEALSTTGMDQERRQGYSPILAILELSDKAREKEKKWIPAYFKLFPKLSKLGSSGEGATRLDLEVPEAFLRR